MDYIKLLCYENKDRIASAKNHAAEITNVMFEHIRDYITRIVDNDKFIKHRKIVMMGGIQINAQPDHYFEPRIFCVIDDHGTHDMLDKFLSYDTIKDHTRTRPCRTHHEQFAMRLPKRSNSTTFKHDHTPVLKIEELKEDKKT
jgi:hypothetical protein